MNLRIAPEYIRFRIAEEELEALHHQGSLTDCTHMANQLSMAYTLQLERPEDCMGSALLKLHVQHDAQGMRVVVTVAKQAMVQLYEPSSHKDGIREFLVFDHGGLLTVDLQVDLHSKKDL